MQDKIMVGLIGDDGKCKDAHKVLKEVLAEVFPGHEFSDYDMVKDGVKFGYVDGGGIFHAKFIGVKLAVNDQYYRSVVRSVRLGIDGTIDASKVRAKLEELKVILAHERDLGKREQAIVDERQQAVKKLREETGIGDAYNSAYRLLSRNLGTYTLELNGLTEGQVRLVMETVEGIFE